ncbi:MAG: DUF5018 domain-containing protein, partial [Bacteroidales bacterium]|nr:DUF5018 domain-containing protein [Bacteroidales bacterium]
MKKVFYFRNLFRKGFMWLFFLMAFIFSSNLANAQTVTIGTGTATNRYPLNDYHKYSRSQCLYLSTEIENTGTITKLRWYRSNSEADADAIGTTEIWLMETSNTILTGTTWEGPGTLVATITDIDLGSGDCWYEIDIDDFYYSGLNNLLVSVRTQNAAYVSPDAFWRYTLSADMARLGGDNFSNPPTMSLSYYRPNIQLDITHTLCTGMPAPGNTIASTNPVCFGANFNLSLQNLISESGITYQWQSSTDNLAWTNIGTDLNTLTTSVLANTYYQCVVTCTNTSETATSTAVLVNINALESLPFTEGFNATTIPECWSTDIIAPQTGTKISFVTTGTSPTTVPQEGTHFIKYNSYSSINGGTGSEERLKTPPITTTGVASVDIEFDLKNENNTSYNSGAYLNEGVQVQYSTDGFTWTDAGSLYPRHNGSLVAGSSEWDRKILTLPAAAGNQALLFVALKFHSAYGNNIFVDNISLKPTPTCPTPTALFVDNIATTSADLNWTENGTATAWNLKVTTSSTFDPTTDTGNIFDGAATGNPHAISTLTENTTYYYYVQTDCTGGDLSEWSNSRTFNTPIACPAPTNLTAANITATSADFVWIVGGFETGWNIKVNEATAIDPITEVGNIVANETVLNTPEYSITSGLTAGTDYYIYVQADCNSYWIEYMFTTVYRPPFNEDFTTYLPKLWKEFEGILAAPTTTTGSFSTWSADGFANVGTTGAANLENFGTSRKEWLVSPSIDLGDGSASYVLEFNLALTKYNTTIPAETTGTDDKFAVVISTDNGATWSSANTLQLWDNASSPYVYNNIATAGEIVAIDLSSYTGIVKIGFYGESTISNADNDLFIDNFAVRSAYEENDILTFSFTAQTGPATISATNHTVDIEVVMGTDLTTIVPIFTISDFASVDMPSGIAHDFSAPVAYTVTSEAGVDQIWNVTVTQSYTQSTEKNILTFILSEQTGAAVIDNSANTIAIEVDWFADVTALTPTITISDFATISPLSGVEQDFSTSVTYTVTAEDASTKDYLATVTQEAIPAGAICAAAIDYGAINSTAIESTITNGTNIWYSFILDQDYANVVVSSCGSNFDNRLAVYADCGDFAGGYGNTIGYYPAGCIGFNDNACVGGEHTTGIGTAAVIQMGTLTPGTYYAVMYGYGNESNGNTRFEVTGSTCAAPNSITAEDLTATSANIAWVASDLAETEWVISVSSSALNDPSTETGDITDKVTVTTTPLYELAVGTLTLETMYYVYIQSACGSDWAQYTFTTLSLCPVPTGLTATNIGANTATLTWNESGVSEWLVKVSTTPLTDPETETANIENNTPVTPDATFNATGLDANTEY